MALNPDLPPPTPHRRLIDHLRAYFFAGILVTGPISLTLYLCWLFVHFIDETVKSLFPPGYNPASYLPFTVPGFGLVIAVVGLTLVGALTAGYLGRVFVRLSDRVVARMPVVRGIYGAVKQIFETVLAKQSNSFREVVLIEFPRRGAWSVGFVTARPDGIVQERAGPEAVAVLVPTTPNPTSGYLVFVPRRDLVVLAMTVEEGIKLVVSGGIVMPPERPLTADGSNRRTPELASENR